MNANSYKISLAIRHPSLDPAEVTATLGLVPGRCYAVGDDRTSPTGRVIGGRWSESKWGRVLFDGNWPSISLAVALRKVLDTIEQHSIFFQRIRSEGGATVISVGWFFEGMSGDLFDCRLLQKFADLSLDLELHVYPPEMSETETLEESRLG
jgi:hypothetical protein